MEGWRGVLEWGYAFLPCRSSRPAVSPLFPILKRVTEKAKHGRAKWWMRAGGGGEWQSGAGEMRAILDGVRPETPRYLVKPFARRHHPLTLYLPLAPPNPSPLLLPKIAYRLPFPYLVMNATPPPLATTSLRKLNACNPPLRVWPTCTGWARCTATSSAATSCSQAAATSR